jgi:hypothetical protein
MNTIIFSNQHGDRYGYYQIGERKTYNKYELMDLHYQNSQSWQWYYNDEFFSRYDWSKEPKESINTLYKKRAEKLREDYDYLVLYYSGGLDSSNMLHAFLDNNIILDEICIFYSRFDQISNQYEELTNITWQKIKQIQNIYPNIKIRKLDYADYFLKWDHILKSVGLGKDFLYMLGATFGLNYILVDLMYRYIEDWQKVLKKGKKLTWIHGVDKPQLRYIDKKWIFNFHDYLIQSNTTPLRQLIDNGTIGTYEFFYWAPTDECARIIIKQCHLLKQRYNEQASQDFSKIPNSKSYKEGYGWELDKMSDDFCKTIYPRNFINNEIFYTKKNSQVIWGNRDHWFFNKKNDASQKHWQLYLATKDNLHKHFRLWTNDGQNINNGFKNCLSRDYII